MYNDRNRLQAGVGKIALRPRAQRVERRVAHPLDRGDIRGMHLPGREAVQKRRLVYIADSNLAPILRILASTGSPKEFADQRSVVFWLTDPTASAIVILILPPGPPENRSSATGR